MKKAPFFSTIFSLKALTFILPIVFFILYSVVFFNGIIHQDSFTWMDPYQYYGFAFDFVKGIRSFNQFELPSIFPFFIAPFLKISPSIPSALFANLVFVALIILAGLFLCGYFDIKKWFYVVIIPFMCSPLIIGLSHSIYSELALSAMVAWQYVIWFKCDHFQNRFMTIAFILLFCIGMMTKSTYPVFFIGPGLLEATYFIKNKSTFGLCILAGVFIIPVTAVILTQKYVFPNSFEYYTSGFYTHLPIMPLIGPSKISLIDSISYYFANIWKSMLFLLTPFLIFPLLSKFKYRKDLYLWAWFAVSLMVLTIPQVKEPRHIAPAILPALFLIVLGISRIKRTGLKIFVTSLLLFLSVGQFFQIIAHQRHVPYLLDRPSHHIEIVQSMVNSGEDKSIYIDSKGIFDFSHWKFTKNFVITGYDPAMALSLTWNLGPGVVYDIDFMTDPQAKFSKYGFNNFEDLYFLEAFNTYNRQSLYKTNYESIDSSTVIENADFLIAGEETSASQLESFYNRFHLVQQWKTQKGTISLLKANTPSLNTYRTIYGREYLSKGKMNPETFSAIYFDLLMNVALRHDSAAIIDLQKELQPHLNSMAKPKNIYWIRNRKELITQMNAFLAEHRGSATKE
jgi:hypothetical protein